MAQTFEFYTERADAAAAAAKEAELDNVKERELRSEKTWRGLAEQARKGAIEREKADAARVAKREAEAEAAASS
ncbi:MAG: hypothetical protein WA985_01025 [Erythrobacter sp.]|uniref:hypothetical protein n=1 Tax=Erythrobacter sp. TaxID=1042 RepID=UPI003C7797C1